MSHFIFDCNHSQGTNYTLKVRFFDKKTLKA